MALKPLRAHAVATGHPERHRVISLMPGYHGATLQTLALNGDIGVPALWGPLAVESEKIPAPLTFRAPSAEAAADASCAALEAAIARIGPQQVLAFVMEPIGGQASGANMPHPSFARRAREICTRYGIHLVFDEIVSAFRTGRFLAAQHDPAAMPDVVVLAKGLAAGYAPLGTTLVSAALAEEVAVTTGFTVSHSYDASPIACAAGAAVLDEITGHRLIDRAAVLGTRLRDGLERIACASPLIGDVRRRGLLLALELVADKETSRRFPEHADPAAIIRRHGLDHGLLLYARRQNAGRYGDWLLIAPPLVIDESTCDELLDRLETTLTAAPPKSSPPPACRTRPASASVAGPLYHGSHRSVGRTVWPGQARVGATPTRYRALACALATEHDVWAYAFCCTAFSRAEGPVLPGPWSVARAPVAGLADCNERARDRRGATDEIRAPRNRDPREAEEGPLVRSCLGHLAPADAKIARRASGMVADVFSGGRWVQVVAERPCWHEDC